MTSSADIGTTPQERWGATFQPEHGTAERWDTCDCLECRLARRGEEVHRVLRGHADAPSGGEATGRPTASALRHTLAALLRTAVEVADKWEEAARVEWAPLAPDYHAGDGEVTKAVEGPYVEHRLAMVWRGQVRRMADNLSVDEVGK